MAESLHQRRRRKFGVGMLDQLATILSGVGVSALAAGVFGPLIAGVLGSANSPAVSFQATEAVAATVAVLSGFAAVVLKGWAKRLDDDMDRT